MAQGGGNGAYELSAGRHPHHVYARWAKQSHFDWHVINYEIIFIKIEKF